ncbi:transposase [Streptomyces canus]|uniref:transposase n=1 Tax=Streptomyces canus TaxID=58343 RepID=UPI003F4BC451
MEDRQVVNGMVCKIRTGISWRDLPDRYGPGRRSTPASAATPWRACSPRASVWWALDLGVQDAQVACVMPGPSGQ